MWLLRCTERVVFCFLWNLSEGFEEGIVVATLLVDTVADLVEVEHIERVALVHVQSRHSDVVSFSLCWVTGTLEM